MRTLRGPKLAVATSLLAVWAAFTYACTVEEENPAPNRTRGVDDGTDGSVDPASQPDAQLGAPICGKYGGYAAVKGIADAIITRASQDCRISGGFAQASADDGLAHLKECFEIQLGSAFQCEGVSYVANTSKDSKGDECRSMSKAHEDLPGGRRLRNADFDAFIEAVAAELQAHGVTDTDDLRSVAAYFEGSRNLVVQERDQPKANSFCDPGTCTTCTPPGGGPIGDGGTDAGTDAGDASDQ